MDAPFLPKLQDIEKNQEFERLDDLLHHRSSMNDEEKSLFATLLTKAGKKLLEIGDEKAGRFFEEATSLDPCNAELLYNQAVAWIELGKRTGAQACIANGIKKYEKILFLQPKRADVARKLAGSLALLASLSSDSATFALAEERFSKSETSFLEEVNQEELFQFYWDWGVAAYLLGKHSGEAVDFNLSAEKFRKALAHAEGCVHFWHDYGSVLEHMAGLLSSTELFSQAISFFQLCVQEDEDYFEGWFSLARASQALFEITGAFEDFERAKVAFEHCVALCSENANVFVHYGQLLVSFGKLEHCVEAIEESLEKFEHAEGNAPGHPLVYAGWGEALMLLGMYREEISLLMEAKEKIVKGLELAPEQAEVWGCYGFCLYELGRYFQDEHYFRLAIQKFQYGLGLDGSRAWLWLGLSRANFALGELKGDIASLELAVAAASKAVSLRKLLPILWVNHGVCLLQLFEMTQEEGTLHSAIEKFEMAQSQLKREGEDHTLYLECLYHLACALDALGDLLGESAPYAKAVEALNYVISKESSYFQARVQLASSLVHLGETTDDADVLTEALDHFRLLTEEDGEDCFIYADFGLALLNLAFLALDTGRPAMVRALFNEAEEKLMRSVSLGGTHAYYYLACLNALSGSFDLAIHFLQKAAEANVLPSIDDMMEDEWLASLRENEHFKAIISQLKTKSPQEPA